MTQTEALKLALEALETYHGYMEPLLTVFGGPRVPAEKSTTYKVEKAITAIKEALAQQPQSEARGLSQSNEQEYKRGYADAMNWKLQNHLEHFPSAQQSNEQVEPEFKLMPREATREMLEAMDECSMDGYERLYAGHAGSVYMAAWDAFAHPLVPTAQPKEPEQEPVIDKSAAIRIATSLGWSPQRTWVGLTDEEIFDVWLNEIPAPDKVFYQKLCRSIEAKLKEKNENSNR